jgi:TRAP-type C4-dicarboxylate transport system substrate-binding protein
MWLNSNTYLQGGIEMKKVLMVVLTALMVFTMTGIASAQFKATMKIASSTPPDHPYNVGSSPT